MASIESHDAKNGIRIGNWVIGYASEAATLIKQKLHKKKLRKQGNYQSCCTGVVMHLFPHLRPGKISSCHHLGGGQLGILKRLWFSLEGTMT